MEDVARVLCSRGYKVVSMYEASNPDTQVNAFLYTSYHPDIDTSFNNLSETDNIVFNQSLPHEESSVIMLNVTGLGPEEAVDILEERLNSSTR